MPNDAKLGLVVGVAVVIAVAVLFFHEDPARGPGSRVAFGGNPGFRGAARSRPINGQVASRTTVPGQRYTVQEGDTLASLAKRYYGDSDKADAIRRQNQDVIKTADALVPGTILVIPERAGVNEQIADK